MLAIPCLLITLDLTQVECELTVIILIVAKKLAKIKGERRQIFRDEVDHLKGVNNRPVETGYGFYDPQEEQYDRPQKPAGPTYQDNYGPEFPDIYRPPTYQVFNDYFSNCCMTFDLNDSRLNARLIRTITNRPTKMSIINQTSTNRHSHKTINRPMKMITNLITK